MLSIPRILGRNPSAISHNLENMTSRLGTLHGKASAFSSRFFNPALSQATSLSEQHMVRGLSAFASKALLPKLPNEIVEVPKPDYALRLKNPGIITRVDLTDLPKPSGYGDRGLELAVFDSAGTLTGSGVNSPWLVYSKIFEKFGVPITEAEAREPMGKQKFRHLKQILFEVDIEADRPSVKERWKEKYGKHPTEEDAIEMFKLFPKMQLDILESHEIPITGAREILHNMRQMKIKTASTTGFLTGMDAFNQQIRETQYQIDYPCDAEQVPFGRPRGDMVLLAQARANVAPSYCVKLGDTQGDDSEGLKANAWTVGVTMPSTYVGKTEEELNNISNEKLEKYRAHAIKKHVVMQPHYIIDGIWEFFPVLRQIDLLVRKGYHPFDFSVMEDVQNPESLYNPAYIVGYPRK